MVTGDAGGDWRVKAQRGVTSKAVVLVNSSARSWRRNRARRHSDDSKDTSLRQAVKAAGAVSDLAHHAHTPRKSCTTDGWV
jgi:hypothetical protein